MLSAVEEKEVAQSLEGLQTASLSPGSLLGMESLRSLLNQSLRQGLVSRPAE